MSNIENEEKPFSVKYIGVNYLSELNCACPLIYRNSKIFKDNYYVECHNALKDELVIKTDILKDDIWEGPYQYYMKWHVKIFDTNNQIVVEDVFNIERKNVLINMLSDKLGDTLAWLPYVEEFRLQNKCKIICCCNYTELFINCYPEIFFISDSYNIKNIYAKYDIGVAWDGNPVLSPNPFYLIPLQKQASDILGLSYSEIKPKITNVESNLEFSNKKYICISEFSSVGLTAMDAESWQFLVDKLLFWEFDVVSVSKEKTVLKNTIKKSGLDLLSVMSILKNCTCFIGSSSGLSWLAWAMGKKIVMLSSYTPIFHEFQSNCLHINSSEFLLQRVLDKINPYYTFKVKEVISQIEKWFKSEEII